MMKIVPVKKNDTSMDGFCLRCSDYSQWVCPECGNELSCGLEIRCPGCMRVHGQMMEWR